MSDGIPEEEQEEGLEVGVPIRHKAPLFIRYTDDGGVIYDVIPKLIIHHPQKETDTGREQGDGAILGGVFARGGGLC
jgi:hypothetical protein